MTRYESKHVAHNAIIYCKNTIHIPLCLTIVFLSFNFILQTLRGGKREVSGGKNVYLLHKWSQLSSYR